MYHIIADIFEGMEIGQLSDVIAYSVFAVFVIGLSLALYFISLGLYKRVLAVFLTEDQSHTEIFDKLGRRISSIAITFVLFL